MKNVARLRCGSEGWDSIYHALSGKGSSNSSASFELNEL